MNKYTSEITEPGLLRGCPMFDTYNAKFYLDNNNQIVWLVSDDIEWWKMIWQRSWNIIDNWYVWNVVKFIIEWKRFESIPELLNELTIAYKNRIIRILAENNSPKTLELSNLNYQKRSDEQKKAA